MIAVIDYGVGNLYSLKCSLDSVGIENKVVKSAEEIKAADKIILPGVGAFEDAAKNLAECGLDKVVLSEAASGKPIMGICLGMQLLFDKSYEYGEHKGLGLVGGNIISISDVVDSSYKVPHIGWNALHFPKDRKRSPIFKYLNENDCVYFVHSYFGTDCDDFVVATTEYGAELTAAVQNKNVFGCQFHPEKSGDVGLKILKAFDEYVSLEDGK